MKKIDIVVENSYAYFSYNIRKLSPTILEMLREKSSYLIKRYAKPPIRRHTFLKHNENWFKLPTGLLSSILRIFDKFKIEYNLKRNNIEKDEPKSVLHFIRKIRNNKPPLVSKLWKHQIRAMKKALVLKRGIVNHATASGKTLTIIGIIYCINKPSLYIIHRKGLAEQTADAIKDYTKLNVGLYAEGYMNLEENITVATVQSLLSLKKRNEKKYFDFIKKIKVLISEEAHHSGADSWKEIIYDCVNATYKLGFTGTAYRGDTGIFLLRATTGNIIDVADYKELMLDGIISELTVYIKDPKCEKIYGDYFKARREGITDNKKRNNLIVKYALNIAKKDKTCLILVGNNLKHVFNLIKIFKSNNYNGIKYITGSEPLFVRRSIKQDFNEGKVKILISTTIFDEGENVPNMNVLIFAVNGKSEINVLQRAGRVLRRTKDKKRAYMIIFRDSHHSTLLSHSEQTLNILKNEKCFKFKRFN